MRSPVIAAEVAVRLITVSRAQITAEIAACRVLRFCKSVLGAGVISRVRGLARVLSNRAQLSKKCGAAA
jgi:hypothetical protein